MQDEVGLLKGQISGLTKELAALRSVAEKQAAAIQQLQRKLI